MPGFWISMATLCLCGLRQVDFQSPHFHLGKKGLPRGPTSSQVLHYKAWLLANQGGPAVSDSEPQGICSRRRWGQEHRSPALGVGTYATVEEPSPVLPNQSHRHRLSSAGAGIPAPAAQQLLIPES